MRVAVELASPEVQGHTAAHVILRDPETTLPVAEIAIRGAGYVVLDDNERQWIANELVSRIRYSEVVGEESPGPLEVPDREGGYHSDEPPLWMTIAAEQAAKRGTTNRVIKVGTKRVRVPESLDDIAYPEGCEFLEPDADGNRIVKVPSRKGETNEMKRFRRACKRARAQQYAFIASQKTPDAVEEGDADEDEGGED